MRELSLQEIESVEGAGAPLLVGVYSGAAFVSGFDYSKGGGLTFNGQRAFDNFTSGFGFF